MKFNFWISVKKQTNKTLIFISISILSWFWFTYFWWLSMPNALPLTDCRLSTKRTFFVYHLVFAVKTQKMPIDTLSNLGVSEETFKANKTKWGLGLSLSTLFLGSLSQFHDLEHYPQLIVSLLVLRVAVQVWLGLIGCDSSPTFRVSPSIWIL